MASLLDPFKALLNPLTSGFTTKKPTTPSTSPLMSMVPTKTTSPLKPLTSSPAPNMSTLSGPVYAPPKTYSPVSKPPVPQVTAPIASTPPAVRTTPSVGTSSTPSPTMSPGQLADLQYQQNRGSKTNTGAPSAPTIPTLDPRYEKDYAAAAKAYEKTLALSPEELSTQEDLDNLVSATKRAYTGTKNKVIPLEFITGQLSAIEDRALNLAEPLESKLARMQAQRLATQEASKFALEQSGKRLDAARSDIKDIRTETESARRFGIEQAANEKKFLEDIRQFDTGHAFDVEKFQEEKRQFGLEYALNAQKAALDAAEKNAATGDPDTLNDKVALINTLSTHAGLNSRVGPTAIARRAFAVADKFGAGQDFAAGVQQLTSKEFVDNLIKAKAQGATFGALTDREGAALRSAATKIAAWELTDPKTGMPLGEWNVDEAAFKKELETVKSLSLRALQKMGYTTTGAGAEDEYAAYLQSISQ